MRHLLVPKKLLQLLITTFLNCCYLVSRDHLDVARTRVRTGANYALDTSCRCQSLLKTDADQLAVVDCCEFDTMMSNQFQNLVLNEIK